MVDVFDELSGVGTEGEEGNVNEDIFTELSQETVPEKKGFKFKTGLGFSPEKEEEITRVATGLGRAFVGPFLGLPGEIQSFVSSLVEPKEQMPQLPTSKTVREKLFDPLVKAVGVAEEPVTEPRGEIEKTARDAAELAGAFTSPLLGSIPKASSILLGSTLPAIAKAAARKFGASETTQNIVGLGTMFASGIATNLPPNPAKFMRDLYKQAESLIPQGAKTAARGLLSKLLNIKTSLKKGITTPSKSQPLGAIKDLSKKISGGQIAVDELVAAKRDVNELISNPETLERGRTLLKPIAKSVDETLEEYGATNPQFLEKFRDANKIFGEIKDVPSVIKFLEKKTNLTKMDPITAGLILFKPTIFAKAIGAKKGLQAFDILLRKPKIRSLYFQSIKQATAQNAKGLQKIVNDLDKEIRKEKESNPDLFQSLE